MVRGVWGARFLITVEVQTTGVYVCHEESLHLQLYVSFLAKAVLSFLNPWQWKAAWPSSPQWNLILVFTECASSSRMVGTFLSVCALTVLCGLVVVAVSRLLLQKRVRSPGGTAEDGGYHCTGKVSSQKSFAQHGFNQREADVSLEPSEALGTP